MTDTMTMNTLIDFPACGGNVWERTRPDGTTVCIGVENVSIRAMSQYGNGWVIEHRDPSGEPIREDFLRDEAHEVREIVDHAAADLEPGATHAYIRFGTPNHT
ncbi:MAG: hypothetical protein NXI16_01420 [Alphaproteobacteria bacterium]|nr:hypothetical protein [Alphaproteobacteria bacterium]